MIHFMVTMFVVLFIHEFGHLIAAMAVGAKVHSFQVGTGWNLVSLEIGRKKVFGIGMLPFSGHVMTQTTFDWRKTIAILLAGPLLNLIAAVVGAIYGLSIVFICLNIYSVLVSLAPLKGSDGDQIIKTFNRYLDRQREYKEFLAKNP